VAEPDGGRAGQALEVGDEDSGQGHQDRAGVADHRLKHGRPREVVGQLVDHCQHHGWQHRVQQHRPRLGTKITIILCSALFSSGFLSTISRQKIFAQ
jgi:hypothetical protein